MRGLLQPLIARLIRTPSIVDPTAILLIFLPLVALYVAGGPPEEFWGDLVGQSDYVVWGAGYPEILRYFLATWHSPSSSPIWIIWPSPFAMLHSLLYIVTGNVWQLVQVVQVIQLVVATFGMYFLAARAMKSRLARSLATLAYVAAPFFQGQLAHHIFLSWGYALLPIAYYFLLRYMKNPSFLTALAASVLIGTLLVSSPQAAYYLALPLWVFSFVFLALSDSAHRMTDAQTDRSSRLSGRILVVIPRSLFLSLAPFILAVLFSGFYLLPTIFDTFPFGLPGVAASGQRPIWYGGDLVSIITLQYFQLIPFLGYSPSNLFLIVPVVLLPLGFVGILHRRRNPLVLALLVSTVLAFGLSIAIPGVPSLFILMRDLFPGFGLLRTPDRFLPNAILGLSLFAGMGASAVVSKFSDIITKPPRGHPLLKRGASRLRHGLRGKMVGFAIAGLLFSPLVLVFYAQNDQYFLGTFRNTPYASNPSAYVEVRNWIEANHDGQHRILDLTEVGANGLHTLELPRVLYGRESLLRIFGHSPRFPNLLCSIGIGSVVMHSANFSRAEHQQAYTSLRESDLFTETSLGVDELSTLDILQHRLPPRVQPISVFESRIPCPQFSAGRLALVVGGPRTLLMSVEDIPNTLPTLVSLAENTKFLGALFEAADQLVFGQPDLVDFGIMNEGTAISLDSYSQDPWQRMTLEGAFEPIFNRPIERSVDGHMVLGNYAISATGLGAPLRVPIRIESSGDYAVMARVLGSSNGELISATLDSTLVTDFSTLGWRGFRWVNLADRFLSRGDHILEISKKSAGTVVLDALSVMTRAQWSTLDDRAASIIGNRPIRLEYALDPSSLFENSFAGRTIELVEAGDLDRWTWSANQTVRLDVQTQIPGSPTIWWQYSSGPDEFLALDLNRILLTTDLTLSFWLHGEKDVEILSLRLVQEDGSFISYQLSLEFEGWRRFQIPLDSFTGSWSSELPFAQLILIPVQTRGETAVSNLTLATLPRVTPRGGSTSSEYLTMPSNSSVAVNVFIPRASDTLLRLGLGLGYPDQVQVCVDRQDCRTVTNSSKPGEGQYESFVSDGYHQIELVNRGTSTIHVGYLKMEEIREFLGRNLTLMTQILSDGSDYRMQLDSNLPVGIFLGESYDKNWRAHGDDRELTSFVAGLWSNGFIVDRSGTQLITINFSASPARIIGIITSLTMSAILVGVLVLWLARAPSTRRKSDDIARR